MRNTVGIFCFCLSLIALHANGQVQGKSITLPACTIVGRLIPDTSISKCSIFSPIDRQQRYTITLKRQDTVKYFVCAYMKTLDITNCPCFCTSYNNDELMAAFFSLNLPKPQMSGVSGSRPVFTP